MKVSFLKKPLSRKGINAVLLFSTGTSLNEHIDKALKSAESNFEVKKTRVETARNNLVVSTVEFNLAVTNAKVARTDLSLIKSMK